MYQEVKLELIFLLPIFLPFLTAIFLFLNKKLFNQNLLMFDLKTHIKVGNVYYLSYRNKNKRKIVLTEEGKQIAGVFKL